MNEIMKIDTKFTEELQDWMNDEHHDAEKGAMLLIRVNPRNVSYRRWHSLAIMRPERILPKIASGSNMNRLNHPHLRQEWS